jgi:hypothetical protein
MRLFIRSKISSSTDSAENNKNVSSRRKRYRPTCRRRNQMPFRAVYISTHSSGNKIETNEMDGHVASMGERKGVYRVLVGKPEGKRPLGRPRRRWKDNINIFSGSGMWGYGLDQAGSG